MARTEAQMEILSDALDRYNRAWIAIEGGDHSGEAYREASRSECRLYGFAVDCGMHIDEPSTSAWAAEQVTRWLCTA